MSTKDKKAPAGKTPAADPKAKTPAAATTTPVVAEEKEKEKEKKEHHHTHAKGHGHAGTDGTTTNVMDDLSKKQAFKKFSFRGLDINKLLSLNMNQLSQHLRSRQRRKLRRMMPQRYARFVKKLNETKKNVQVGEKPKAIKTHLRDCIVLPSMVQSMINIHTGKAFNNVEIKPEMIGYYLGEFSMTYKKVFHGKPGVGATHSSKFVPIK